MKIYTNKLVILLLLSCSFVFIIFFIIIIIIIKIENINKKIISENKLIIIKNVLKALKSEFENVSYEEKFELDEKIVEILPLGYNTKEKEFSSSNLVSASYDCVDFIMFHLKVNIEEYDKELKKYVTKNIYDGTITGFEFDFETTSNIIISTKFFDSIYNVCNKINLESNIFNELELKNVLIIILFNILICYLLTLSLYKVKSENKSIWIAFLAINFISMFVTYHGGGFTFIKFINGITFGIYPLIITYYLCYKFVFKNKNKLIRNMMLFFSIIIIILVNLILPTHINKFLALNIFKNKNFESQKFYCNVLDNYNLNHKKLFPYIYKLSSDQLNDITVVEIYEENQAPYELTSLLLKDIRKNDLKKSKKGHNSKDFESTGSIYYEFNWFEKNNFILNFPNVKFNRIH